MTTKFLLFFALAAGIPVPGLIAQSTQTPDWYKDTPQPYDHKKPSPRHLHASGDQLPMYDDSPAQQQVAQEAPPSQPYDGQSSTHAQNLPRYEGQSDPQAPPQQNYAQPPDNSLQGDAGYPPDDYGAPVGQPMQQPLGAQQLEQLVAPIALYPDQLVAQLLTASTYPAQITAADQWVRSMNGAAPEQIAQGAAAQAGWDPSVKALTAFPQVLAMLNSNLQWTAAVGNAYYNQPQDVLETIQVLRQRAEQSGNLQSTPQQQVVQQPNYIQIQPADPQYIYVPSYNPWYVYGAPIAPYPAFAFGGWGLYGGGGIHWGLGFAYAPFYNMGFGFAWGVNWIGGGCFYNHGPYWTHSHEVHDWGFRNGGRRWDGGGGYRGGNYARFSGYNHQPVDVHGRTPLGGGYGQPNQPFAGRPQPGSGRIEGGPSRPSGPGNQAYNRMPQAYGGPQGRVQPYGGQTFTGRQPIAGGPQGYAGRPESYARPQPSMPMPRSGSVYGGYAGGGSFSRSPMQSYRAPQSYAPPRSFGGGSGGGQSYARPQQPSSHSFGGGSGFSGGGRSFSGGGHSFGGGGGHASGGGGGHRR